jgi:hypothetical protein
MKTPLLNQMILTSWLVCPFAVGQHIVINEFMASNSDFTHTANGVTADWIELYNPTDHAISLAGMFLSDRASFLTQWQFPSNLPGLTFVDAQGYCLVWASTLNSTATELHAGFSLNADGEGIFLTGPDGFTVIDQIEFGPQVSDVSFGRSPDESATWFFQKQATPGAPNSEGFVDWLPPVQFSQERGFYEEPITLTLTCEDPNAEIWYTLDASIPHIATGGRRGVTNWTGFQYTEPISITRTTCVRAVAVKSMWQDSGLVSHSFIYLDDVMTQPARPEGFPAQWTPNVVDYAMDRRVVFDPAYEPTFKQDLLSIPSVCIVIPNEDFFGSQGIYSHAQNSGDAWERAACMEWIDPGTGDAFGVRAGLRIHGGVGRSSSVAKHSLRITFRSEYGSPTLNFPLFNDLKVQTFDSLVLRGCWNYSWTGDSTACGGIGTAHAQYMRDAFARDCMRDMGALTSYGRHVNVYINGLYWGIYILTERPDDGFAAHHLGGRKSDYDVLKASNSFGTAGMETVAGDQAAWKELFDLVTFSNLARDDAYDEIARRVDIPALIDYCLMVVYVGSRDAPTLLCNDTLPRNFYTLRNRTQDTGFVFLPWDVEWSMENESENRVAVLGGQQNPGLLFVRLAANRRFKQLLADRIHRYFFNGGPLTVESAILRYWERSEDLARAIVGESARWGDARRPGQPYTRDNEWASERSRLLNNYLSTRTHTVFNQLRSRGYYPQLNAPVFKVNGNPADQNATVALGDTITMQSDAGMVYYTRDGTDPMATLTDNSDSIPPAAPTAKVYQDPFTVQGRVWLKARTFSNGLWSALNEAVFTLAQK